MSDFFQNGVITTLHRLGPGPDQKLDTELRLHTRTNPVSLVIPCLITELERPAIGRIVEILTQVDYLDEIVIPVGRAAAAGAA